MRYAVLRQRDQQVKVYTHPDEALKALGKDDQLFVGRSLMDLRRIFPELADVEEDVRPEEKKGRHPTDRESNPVASDAEASRRSSPLGYQHDRGRPSGPGLAEPTRYRKAAGGPP